ncbi:MAG: UDP-3-O-(3-hydroxymyristoyl)glucosamine N-acyltransferase [Burkholderiales bacterium]
MNGSAITYSLGEISERFGGEVLGDARIRIARVATLETAGAEAISFLANERYSHQLKTTGAAAVIVGPAARDAVDKPRIVTANPYLYFARVSALLNPPREAIAGIHPQAVVDPSATIDGTSEVGAHAVLAAGVHVGANAVIGPGVCLGRNVRVGRDSRIHAQVAVYDECVIGERVILHSGVVVGADGFGIAFDGERWVKVPQVGRVRIGDDVEVGANTTIDRGALEDTVIEDGVKLDNQIQIAHNVRIGAHTAIAACTGIAGSVQIGRYCRIGGAVGIAGHVTIADRVEISGHTSITKSIDKAGAYSGVYPFEPNRQWRRNAVQLRHLADIARRLAAAEKELEQLKHERRDS